MDTANPYASPLAAGSELSSDVAENPLTLLGALGAGTALFWRRFPTLAAITLIVWLPIELLVSYQEYFVLAPDDVLGLIRWTMVMESLVGIIAIGGIVTVSEAALRGEHRGWLTGLIDGLRGWPRLFATRFVGGCVLLIAAMFFILPAVYLFVRYAFADIAAIVERRAGTGALGRSMTLTRGRFLVMLGLYAATVGPLLVSGGVIFVPLGLFPEYDNWLTSTALSCFLDLIGSWMTVVFVVAYVQCRTEENRSQRHASNPLAASEEKPGPADRLESSDVPRT